MRIQAQYNNLFSNNKRIILQPLSLKVRFWIFLTSLINVPHLMQYMVERIYKIMINISYCHEKHKKAYIELALLN